jgi:multidrug efflux system membrane fusion protein
MSALPPVAPPPASVPPERRRPRWLAVVAGLAVIALLAAGAWYLWGRGDGATPPAAKGSDAARTGKGAAGKGGRFGADPSRVQPVAAAEAKTGDLRIIQTALGNVVAGRIVTVRPRVDGMLQSVGFADGQAVKAGELLAQIDPAPFQVALAQAEGQLARDAAQLNNARLDLERYRTLLQQDSIAKQQVDQQASLVKQLEGTVKVDQAQVDNAKLQLSYTRITAPTAGKLGLRLVDAGNMVRSSDANGIAVITQVDPISVLFTIPQDTLPRVLARLAGGEKPPVEAWDRDNKLRLATGRLTSTDNQIDVATGTVKLKAEFANRDGVLFPNQFVNVRMVVDVLKGAVVVPSAAIQRNNQGTIVYVVTPESTVAIRPIVVGPTEGQLTAVASGLQAGERVIVDGVDRVREGARVEVTEPGAGLRAPPPAAGGAGKRDDSKKPTEGMTPEQRREEFRKRMEGMTPEQREEMKKRRQAGEGKAAP